MTGAARQSWVDPFLCGFWKSQYGAQIWCISNNDLLDRLGAAHFYSTIDITKYPGYPKTLDKSSFPHSLSYTNLSAFCLGCLEPPRHSPNSWTESYASTGHIATAYLDDIIYSNDWQWNLQHLTAVLRSLRQAALTANPKNCTTRWVEIQYLGFHLGHGQVHSLITNNALECG